MPVHLSHLVLTVQCAYESRVSKETVLFSEIFMCLFLFHDQAHGKPLALFLD